MERNYIAFDLGAGSGRSILGTFDGDKLQIEELTRFNNEMIQVLGHYHWDIYRLFEALKDGLKANKQKGLPDPASIAVDTWGVDYGLLAKDGSLLGIPYAYRDSRTDGMMEEVFSIIPKNKVYEYTGIQFMQLNTIFQLFASRKMKNEWLNHATDLLFIPDLLNYLFTGIKKSEFSFATTSQLFNPNTKTWEKELFKALDVPISIMQDIVMPGTILGKLSRQVAEETGIGEVPVVSVASHDTGSAVAAVPAQGKNWAYLSSGTWSLMGIEAPAPIINEKTLAYNFTNEGGVEGTIRFLKNITGMWLLQQSKKAWAIKKDYSYEELIEMAKSEQPFQCLVDNDAHDFMNPADMPTAIREYCRKTGQQVPETEKQIVRCIFDSMVMKYRFVLEQLKELAPFPIEKLHIIGGGSKNKFLNQLTADATGLTVVAGPAEATAIGNIMVQAKALGHVQSLEEMRAVISRSFECETYQPRDSREWQNAYEKYLTLINH